MAAHTPGPWTASDPDDFGDITIKSPNEELAVAVVCNGAMRILGNRWNEHAANARLITAAPPMLAFLERLEAAEIFVGEDLDELNRIMAMVAGEAQ